MSFDSIQYALFLGLSAIIYFVLPSKYRVGFLLAASIYFYAQFSISYVAILICSILVNYCLGLALSRKNDRGKRALFVTGLFFNVLFLVFFRIDLVKVITGSKYSLATLNVIMPLGISFYTFSCMAYLIEIYRRKTKAERSLIVWASALSFFPKILQGPIERPSFLAQFHERRSFEYQRVSDGLKLIGWGLFKKVVVADRAAMYLDPVFHSPQKFEDIQLLWAALFFSIQVYADFSGYTDVAIGSAKILGFELTPNFNRPYFASSIREFWNRWHISLSFWLKDYVFLPTSFAISRRIKGDRVLGIAADHAIYLLAINITFLICGLWHGMSWKYVIWGLLFGFYLSLSQCTAKLRKSAKRRFKLVGAIMGCAPWKISWTFLLVSFAWIFFRAESIADAVYFATHILRVSHSARILEHFRFLLFNFPETFVTFLFAAVILAVEFMQGQGSFLSLVNKCSAWQRWLFYYFIVVSILSFGAFGRSQFLYFQF